jgi:hypothetical protein
LLLLLLLLLLLCIVATGTSVALPCGSLEEARAAFLQQHGAAYGYNGWLDANYHQELGKRLDGQRYLDWTGK